VVTASDELWISPKRVCSICGNEFSRAIEFCPVCIRTLNLQSLSAPSKNNADMDRSIGTQSVSKVCKRADKRRRDAARLSAESPDSAGRRPFSFRKRRMMLSDQGVYVLKSFGRVASASLSIVGFRLLRQLELLDPATGKMRAEPFLQHVYLHRPHLREGQAGLA
jgi:hypothetical protein